MRADHQPWRPCFLRRTSHCRRATPPSTPRTGQSPRRHPARLPTPPHPLQRRQSLGTPTSPPRLPGRL